MLLTERIVVRCTPEQKAVIVRAAKYEGVSVSQFIRASVLAAAEKTLKDYAARTTPWGCRYCTRERPCRTENCVQNSLDDRQRIHRDAQFKAALSLVAQGD